MRFQIGDILRMRAQRNTIRWRIEDIEGERYFITYVLAEGEEWRNGSWHNEAACSELELDNLQQPPEPPVQQEVTIYTVFFKLNPNGPINCMSFTSSQSARGYKASAERIGYSVVAMKKFKTRI